jgi:hypothetical protein
MLKKIVLALMPLTLLASVNADDALDIDVSSITDADIQIVENDLDIDVDALSANAGEDSEETAIEACFRRCGYNYRGWGGGYHNSYYNHCYNTCYNYCRPLYSYRTISYCPPVCRVVCAPIYTYYWGCH